MSQADPTNPMLPPWCSVEDALRSRGLLDVAEEIAAEHHVLLSEMLGRRRKKSPVAARHELWRTLRRCGLSSVEVGDLFGVDHTSVLNAWKGGV